MVWKGATDLEELDCMDPIGLGTVPFCSFASRMRMAMVRAAHGFVCAGVKPAKIMHPDSVFLVGFPLEFGRNRTTSSLIIQKR